jgi:hypothetical protein
LTHGLSDKTEATEQKEPKSEEAKGTTGFLFWETLDGFKFDTVDNVVAGKVGIEHKDLILDWKQRSKYGRKDEVYCSPVSSNRLETSKPN